jgi:5'-nucleotidase
MRILLSNDDGVYSPNFQALFQLLQELKHEVLAVAPDRDRSGASNSLTLDQPLRPRQIAENLFMVNGTPTDCVHIALHGMMVKPPDIVLSGINLGLNLGDDVWYSGTVAAAIEGRSLGFPAMALSMDIDASGVPKYLETGLWVVKNLLDKLAAQPLNKDLPQNNLVFNVNIPDVPLAEIQGFAATRLGFRHASEGVVVTKDPRSRICYWIGPPGGEADAGEGTDFYAIRQGSISVTPLRLDLTHHDRLLVVKDWLVGK